MLEVCGWWARCWCVLRYTFNHASRCGGCLSAISCRSVLKRELAGSAVYYILLAAAFFAQAFVGYVMCLSSYCAGFAFVCMRRFALEWYSVLTSCQRVRLKLNRSLWTCAQAFVYRWWLCYGLQEIWSVRLQKNEVTKKRCKVGLLDVRSRVYGVGCNQAICKM